VDNELEVIRGQMEETRASLAEKLQALEHEVLGPVEGAAEAVANTVETVQETVENVKDTLDLNKHVQNHPWLMMSGAVAVGYLGGCLIAGPTRRADAVAAKMSTASAIPAASTTSEPVREANGHAAGKKGQLEEWFQSLCGLAVGTLLSVVRDAVTRSLPANMAPEVSSLVDDLTTRLGGRPLRSNTAPNNP